MRDELKILSIVKVALKEDIGKGDITTDSLIPPDQKVKAIILAKEDGILAGLDVARLCFKSMDKSIKFIPKIKDGEEIRRGSVIARLEGKASKILSAERTALNFLMHLSGISTLTKKFVEKIKPYKVKITDTRKTIPGLRILEKYAVRIGGGFNHRMGLWEQVLIKENHINSLKFKASAEGGSASGGKSLKFKNLIEETKKKNPEKKIEIEVKDLKEFEDVLEAKPDIIMLDNMGLKDIKKAIKIRNQKLDYNPPITLSSSASPSRNQTTTYPRFTFFCRFPKLEVSGNVSLENVNKIAQRGVDIISIGCLTHSAKAIDMSLEIL